LPSQSTLSFLRYGDRIEVRKIITSVVDALSEDSARKFVYVEQVFFQMWWNDQPERVRGVVRQLVAGAPLFSPSSSGPHCFLQAVSCILQTAAGSCMMKHVCRP
jgi:hypothetical protein